MARSLSLRSRKGRKLEPGDILTKPAPGNTFTDVLREIRSKVDPNDSGATLGGPMF